MSGHASRSRFATMRAEARTVRSIERACPTTRGWTAATGVRRASCSRMSRSRPSASTITPPASMSDQHRTGVVPHAVRVGAQCRRTRRSAPRATAQMSSADAPIARNCRQPKWCDGSPLTPTIASPIERERRPDRHGPAPTTSRRDRRSPRTARPWRGWSPSTATGTPSTTQHNDVANHGRPRLAFVEPSSGSTTTIPRRCPSAPACWMPALLRQHVEPGGEQRLDAHRVDLDIDVVLAGPHARLGPVQHSTSPTSRVRSQIDAEQARSPNRPRRLPIGW